MLRRSQAGEPDKREIDTMHFVATTTLVFCVLGGSAALAQTPPDTTAPAATDVAAPAPEKKICKTMAAPTGSRVGSERVCATQAEWNAHFHGGATDGANGIYVPGLATSGGIAPPQAVPHGGGGHGL
jgi:hypothetical protein